MCHLNCGGAFRWKAWCTVPGGKDLQSVRKFCIITCLWSPNHLFKVWFQYMTMHPNPPPKKKNPWWNTSSSHIFVGRFPSKPGIPHLRVATSCWFPGTCSMPLLVSSKRLSPLPWRLPGLRFHRWPPIDHRVIPSLKLTATGSEKLVVGRWFLSFLGVKGLFSGASC